MLLGSLLGNMKYGTMGGDILNGTDANDLIYGLAGHDSIDGGAGNDNINAGWGNDEVRGGAGWDILTLGAGNDLGIFEMAANSGNTSLDRYFGGFGTDMLRLEFTKDEWFQADVQNDIADYLLHLDRYAGKLLQPGYTFSAFKLLAHDFEALEVTVDGVSLNPVDEAVTLMDDTADVAENSSVIIDVLANDDVPDLVKELTLVSNVANGVLTQTADDTFEFEANADFDYLPEGVTATETFEYQVVDADGDTETATATITITGVNDEAVISGDTDGTVTEDDVLTATGKLDVADVDEGEAFIQADSFTGTYGTLDIDEDGNWTYTLDNDSAAVQGLIDGEMKYDTFIVSSLDGSDQEQIDIFVNGADGNLTVDFEDLDPGENYTVVQDGYMGFNWDYVSGIDYGIEIVIVNQDRYSFYPGIAALASLAAVVNYPAEALSLTRDDGDAFKLLSVDLADLDGASATATLKGYLDDVLVHEEQFDISTSLATFDASGWGEIDRLEISENGSWLLMDNFEFLVA